MRNECTTTKLELRTSPYNAFSNFTKKNHGQIYNKLKAAQYNIYSRNN